MAPAPAPAGRLAGALAGSLLLHAALLTGLNAPPRDWLSGAAGGSARPISVRFQAPVAPAPAEPARVAAVLPQAPPVQMVPRPAPPAGAPHGGAQEQRAGILPPAKYYTALELDRRPQPLAAIEPAYPTLALSPVGRVTLALYINESGEVDRVVVESADQSGDFAGSAERAFGGARFLPGVRGGVPVKSLMRIEVRFGEPLEHTTGGQESVPREKFVPTVRVRPRK
jgi:hypothetical protein